MKNNNVEIIVNDISKKQVKIKKVKICLYCFMNVKKLIKCNGCNDKFCHHCLHEINKNEFLCPDCIVKLVKEKALLIITK